MPDRSFGHPDQTPYEARLHARLICQKPRFDILCQIPYYAGCDIHNPTMMPLRSRGLMWPQRKTQA